MKMIDSIKLQNKTVEKTLRQLDYQIDIMNGSTKLSKDNFFELFSLIMELHITAFKRIEENYSPDGKVLEDYTGEDILAACNRVGSSSNFAHDRDFVLAVLMELKP